MTPKSKSEFSSTEAIPLPALDPNPKQAWASIGCTARPRLPELRAETAKTRLTPPPTHAEALFQPIHCL
jgi:hypothetical protein